MTDDGGGITKVGNENKMAWVWRRGLWVRRKSLETLEEFLLS
jgi:hypothetical protein